MPYIEIKIIYRENDQVKDLLNEVINGSIKGILTFGIDPGYTLPMGIDFVQAVQKWIFQLYFPKENEASSGAKYVAAVPHFEAGLIMNLRLGIKSSSAYYPAII